MRPISRAIDRFCAKHRRFGIPRLMLGIVGLTAMTLVLLMMDRTKSLTAFMMFSPARILKGEVWRLFTWLILPNSSNLLRTGLALYFYYFIGNTLEREWGAGRFTIYYFTGVVLNIIYGFITWAIMPIGMRLDPFYLNLSMFFAFAVRFPDQKIMLFYLIPVKIKWLALVDAALFLYGIVSALFAQAYMLAFLPVIAILNFFLICGSELIDYLRRNTRLFRNRKTSSNVVDFRKAAREAKKRADSAEYRHKCEVCGKTDKTDPELTFRYCSRCEGYHCFCEEHINNHTHVQ
ncbi:MAG: rhomboid family intramembrane serine protease [Oscillospiraceae bacterium]|nr:rhomboid family intramembrane serine protease [Oscillospiraceae bacterium]